MGNPTLNINKVFREQVGKFFKKTFLPITMSGISNFMNDNNICVI